MYPPPHTTCILLLMWYERGHPRVYMYPPPHITCILLLMWYERGHPRVPPCNVLKNVFFVICGSKHLKIQKKNYFINGLKTWRLYVIYRHTYVCMHVCIYVHAMGTKAIPQLWAHCFYLFYFIYWIIYLFIYSDTGASWAPRRSCNCEPTALTMAALSVCTARKKKPKKKPKKTQCEPTAFIMAAFCVLIERGGELFSQ